MATRIENLRTGMLADGGISAIVGTRIFYRKAVRQPSDSYIQFVRGSITDINGVREDDRFRFICFSKNMATLESLTQAVITFFNFRTTAIEGDNYFKVRLLDSTDFEIKLKSGFYYSMIDFEFLYAT